MAPPELRLLRSLELPLLLAKSAARLLEEAFATVASIAGNRLAGVQRLAEGTWRRVFACGGMPRERGPDRSVEARIAELAGAGPWEARARAARDLASSRVATAAVAPALVRALRDPSVEVALAAIEALSRHSGPTTARALREVFENADGHFHPGVRAAAVTALVETLPPADLVLVAEAVGDVDAEVSLAALRGLAERAPALVAAQALHVLRDRSGYYLPLVRRAAAEALLQSRELSPASARELRESEPDPEIRDLLERAGS